MDGFNDDAVVLDRMKVMSGMSDLFVQMSQEKWATYVNEIYPKFPISPWTSEKWAQFYRERGLEPPPSKTYKLVATYDSEADTIRITSKEVCADE